MIPGLDHFKKDGIWMIDIVWGDRQLLTLPSKGSGATTKQIIAAELLAKREKDDG